MVKMMRLFATIFCAIVLFQKSDGATFNCTQPPMFSKFDVNSCCRIPEINLGNAPEKCDKYVNDLKKQNKIEDPYPSYTHVCYPDCIYRESNSLINGEIHVDNVQSFLEKNINSRDKDILPQIIRSFQTCIGNIKGHMKAIGIAAYRQLADGCSPYASMIYGCVNAETFLHCPAQMWLDDHNCHLAKHFAEQCNPLPHVPLPLA